MSSSPGLPSPSDLFRRAPLLQTGSRAASITTTTHATFTSAPSLLKTTAKEDKSIELIRKSKVAPDIDEHLVESAAKPKVRKPRAKKATEDGETELKKPVRARAKKTETTANDDNVVKEKATRKPRAKKEEDQTQPKLPNAPITKSGSNKGGIAEKTAKSLASGNDIEDEAKESSKVVAFTPILSKIHPESRSFTKALALPSNNGVSSFINNIGFKNGESSRQQETPSKSTSELPVARKRKSPEISKVNSAPTKPKAVRKKAKTITDQATAAYMINVPEEEVELSERAGAITQFFRYQSKASDVQQITANRSKVPKAATNPRSKISSKSSKLKPGDKGLPILLSPASAIKQYKQQDILFGTSSQLADPQNSPSFIRDMQEALRISNEIDDDFLLDSPTESSKPASTSQRILSHVREGRLWAASSRDEFGSLLNVEVVDLSTTPVAKVKSLVQLSTDEKATEVAIKSGKELPDHDIISTEILNTPDVGRLAKITKPNNSFDVVTSGVTLADSVKGQMSKPPTRKLEANAKEVVSTEKPDYLAYSTAELTKAISSFGFKVVKNRKTMINLLDKCWDSQHGAKSNGEEISRSVVEIPKPSESAGKFASKIINATPVSPKGSRGRPKKVVEAVPVLLVSETSLRRTKTGDNIRTIKPDSDSEDMPLSLKRTPKKSKQKSDKIIDQISDSETALTPSPPRRNIKASEKSPPVLPLKSANADNTKTNTTELNPQSSQSELFSHITKAIKSIPPSTTSSEPNWHEKILLYDPIVLEDLAVWLNEGGLQSVGWDEEVSAWEVKGWCESRSVCCLWRENLKGGVRSRY